MLQWTFWLGQNVTVDVVNLDVSSWHREAHIRWISNLVFFPIISWKQKAAKAQCAVHHVERGIAIRILFEQYYIHILYWNWIERMLWCNKSRNQTTWIISILNGALKNIIFFGADAHCRCCRRRRQKYLVSSRIRRLDEWVPSDYRRNRVRNKVMKKQFKLYRTSGFYFIKNYQQFICLR